MATKAEKAEEFRFAKKQQWYVATAAVTLMAAIFAVDDKVHFEACEKTVAVAALIAIAGFAGCTLGRTQKYIISMREENDRQPWYWSRGGDIMWALIAVVTLIAIAVGYFIICRLPFPVCHP